MSLVWANDDEDSLCFSRDEFRYEPEVETLECPICGEDDGPFWPVEDTSSMNASVGYGEVLLICKRCCERGGR